MCQKQAGKKYLQKQKCRLAMVLLTQQMGWKQVGKRYRQKQKRRLVTILLAQQTSWKQAGKSCCLKKRCHLAGISAYEVRCKLAGKNCRNRFQKQVGCRLWVDRMVDIWVYEGFERSLPMKHVLLTDTWAWQHRKKKVLLLGKDCQGSHRIQALQQALRIEFWKRAAAQL